MDMSEDTGVWLERYHTLTEEQLRMPRNLQRRAAIKATIKEMRREGYQPANARFVQVSGRRADGVIVGGWWRRTRP